MLQPQLLKTVITALVKAKVDYMATGSIVSSLQGEPRSTHDIDLVVAIEVEDVNKLTQALDSFDFYLDKESVIEAIKHKGTFNLINAKEGDKVDFWLLTKEPFDRSRFSRKYAEKVFDFEMKVSTPEDTILAKLKWAKLSGGSEKQFTDALRVYEVQFEKLDLEYVKHWVKELGVENLWQRLVKESEPI